MKELKSGTALVPKAQEDGDVVTAWVSGEIDLHNSPELRMAVLNVLLKGLPKTLALDLAGVPYMDSSAVAVLVEAMQKIRRWGGKIHLRNLQARVKGLLEIARLDTIFVVEK